MSGYKTHVTPSNEKNLTPNTTKDPEQNYRERPSTPENRVQVLPITPKHEPNRDKRLVQKKPNQPSFNGPPESGKGPDEKSLSKDKPRTKGKPGEEYGHPYLDNGPAGIKDRRPLQADGDEHGTDFFAGWDVLEAGLDEIYPSEKQRKQKGQAARYHHVYYTKHKTDKKLDGKKRYRHIKDRVDFDFDQENRRDEPDRFKRKPGGGYTTTTERTEDWRKEHGEGSKEADFYMERGNPSQDSETWYDRGQGYAKKRKQWDERHDPGEDSYPYGFTNNNPGSAKVIPEGHDFKNKDQREMKQAARISDIEARCDPSLQTKAAALVVKLRRVDAKNAIWTYDVEGSSDVYAVKVQAPRKGNVTDVNKLDVFVTCSCPFWQWQGPEHWASQEGYLYGKPRGTAASPDVKDPSGKHGACKHVLAVLGTLREIGSVRKEWGMKRTAGYADAEVPGYYAFLEYSGPEEKFWGVWDRDEDDLKVGHIGFDRDRTWTASLSTDPNQSIRKEKTIGVVHSSDPKTGLVQALRLFTRLQRRASDSGLRYLADRVAQGEVRILSVDRVAARYLRRVIQSQRRE